MSRERKREVKEIAEKGISIAEPGAEVIWNDPKLKTSFISNPFISRLKGRATLEQMLAYNLYFDELTQKWKPLSDISISTVKTLARYYTADPEAPIVQSDLPLRINNKHALHTYDFDVYTRIGNLNIDLNLLGVKLEVLKAFNSGQFVQGSHMGTEVVTEVFSNIGIPWTCFDFYVKISTVNVTIAVYVKTMDDYYVQMFTETFTAVDDFKRRVIFPSAMELKIEISGSTALSFVLYDFVASHLPFEVPITS